MSTWLYFGLAIAVLLIIVVSVFAYRFAKLSKQLQASEERWKFALEGAGDGVWDWNVQTDDVDFSPRYREMYGFSDEDVTLNAKQWQERIHPEDRERVAADVTALPEWRYRSIYQRTSGCVQGWHNQVGVISRHDSQPR